MKNNLPAYINKSIKALILYDKHNIRTENGKMKTRTEYPDRYWDCWVMEDYNDKY